MPRIRQPRFRIEVFPRDGGHWEAKIYDHEDHGVDVPYAGAYGSLDGVLREAAHYALVASSVAPPRERSE